MAKIRPKTWIEAIEQVLKDEGRVCGISIWTSGRGGLLR